MELGGGSRLGEFDGVGGWNKFGENLLRLCGGVSLNMGKVGWKKVVDGGGYMKEKKWVGD